MSENGTSKEFVTCVKCHKNMEQNANYYKLKDGTYHDKCKKCFTMHLNINEPSTILPLLETMDVPYIEGEWSSLVDKYGNNPKTTPTAIFGRYISKMKLMQFNKYTFKDTDKFVEEARMRELRDRAEKLGRINKYRDAKASGEVPEEFENLDLSVLSDIEAMSLMEMSSDMGYKQAMGGATQQSEDGGLTMEDKYYLFNKWGKTYTIQECIRLEKLFNEMRESYDIRTASHKDYLLKICRVSLKIDQALEVNDIDGFQKMSRVYDTLMKSAKFTAAQSKGESDDFTDSLGVIVGLCEEQGFIPQFHAERQDVVDITLADMNKYMNNLIMNEMNLGNMIEIHLQKMKLEDDKEEDEAIEEDEDDDLILIKETDDVLLDDEDFEDYADMIEEDYEIDEAALRMSGEYL